MTTRATRLLHLLDDLRRRRKPVRGAQLAEQLGVSLRTLYRDIDSLRAQGADIAGDPGIGYQLRAGYLLPPMMFSAEELEAMVLGTRWVASHADPELAAAAGNAPLVAGDSPDRDGASGAGSPVTAFFARLTPFAARRAADRRAAGFRFACTGLN